MFVGRVGWDVALRCVALRVALDYWCGTACVQSPIADADADDYANADADESPGEARWFTLGRAARTGCVLHSVLEVAHRRARPLKIGPAALLGR